MCSKTQLERWRLLLDTQQSPCQPPQYEDEPEEGEVDDNRGRDKTGAYRNRSLRYLPLCINVTCLKSDYFSAEFKDFLASHGMEAAEDASEAEESDASLLETSNTNYSDEVRRLLNKDVSLSTSLQVRLVKYL